MPCTIKRLNELTEHREIKIFVGDGMQEIDFGDPKLSGVDWKEGEAQGNAL